MIKIYREEGISPAERKSEAGFLSAGENRMRETKKWQKWLNEKGETEKKIAELTQQLQCELEVVHRVTLSVIPHEVGFVASESRKEFSKIELKVALLIDSWKYSELGRFYPEELEKLISAIQTAYSRFPSMFVVDKTAIARTFHQKIYRIVPPTERERIGKFITEDSHGGQHEQLLLESVKPATA